jgi:hypothetical protein
LEASGELIPSISAESPSLLPTLPRSASSASAAAAASSFLLRLLEPISRDSLRPAVSLLFRRSSTDPLLLPIFNLSSLSLSRKLPCSCSCPSTDASDDDIPTFELFPLRVGVSAKPLSGDKPSLESGSIVVACSARQVGCVLLFRLGFGLPLHTSGDTHADVGEQYCWFGPGDAEKAPDM